MDAIITSLNNLTNPHHLAELSILVVNSLLLQAAVGLVFPVTNYPRVRSRGFKGYFAAFSLAVIWLTYAWLGLALYNPVAFVATIIVGGWYTPRLLVPFYKRMYHRYHNSWVYRAILANSS